MAVHALLVAYLPNARDSSRSTFNHEMLQAGWRQYTIPFTWTKSFADPAEAERETLAELHAALAAAAWPTYSALLQLGAQPAIVDPPGWDRTPGS